MRAFSWIVWCIICLSGCSQQEKSAIEKYLTTQMEVDSKAYDIISIINLEGCTGHSLAQLQSWRNAESDKHILVILTGEIQDRDQKEAINNIPFETIQDTDNTIKKYEHAYTNGLLYRPKERRKIEIQYFGDFRAAFSE